MLVSSLCEGLPVPAVNPFPVRDEGVRMNSHVISCRARLS